MDRFAQALVRWMTAQRSELLDGTEVPLFPGVFGIFGHGNVLGLGTALHEVRDQLPTWRGQTEQGMALAAAAFARATDRRQVMVATSSIGPGALNMVTAAGLAHANRLPLLLLPGDTFTGRGPDPVLQQVEHFDDPTMSVNDAFRAVARYFDRITTPEQLLATLPQVARVLTDPADAGPVVEAAEPTIWTRPDDLPYDAKKPLPKFGVSPDGFNALFADGSVRFVTQATALDKLRNGGTQDARASAANALSDCYHSWLVNIDIPDGQIGRVFCTICGMKITSKRNT
jgi:3D-(3,5/4)-trihydroxycyclohexane-1,2-dione acylhydrolase (decyclizing)